MAQRCADVDEFVERVKELYELDPARVRFVMKYRHADGSLALRATNDELWLWYRTTQASDIRRLEALQLWLMSAMAGSDVETLTREAAEADAAAAERREGKRSCRRPLPTSRRSRRGRRQLRRNWRRCQRN